MLTSVFPPSVYDVGEISSKFEHVTRQGTLLMFASKSLGTSLRGSFVYLQLSKVI